MLRTWTTPPDQAGPECIGANITFFPSILGGVVAAWSSQRWQLHFGNRTGIRLFVGILDVVPTITRSGAVRIRDRADPEFQPPNGLARRPIQSQAARRVSEGEVPTNRFHLASLVAEYGRAMMREPSTRAGADVGSVDVERVIGVEYQVDVVDNGPLRSLLDRPHVHDLGDE